MANLFAFGNDFTINLISIIEKEHREIYEKIDLKNLFAKGYAICAPDGDSAFFSAKIAPISGGVAYGALIVVK